MPDADPKHVYHHVLVGIDPDRHLNNGLPSGLAFLIEALELKAGALGTSRLWNGLLHGDYGARGWRDGRVTGVELDRHLANRAAENLNVFKQVTVISTDASRYRFDPADAVLVNADATHPMAICLKTSAQLEDCLCL